MQNSVSIPLPHEQRDSILSLTPFEHLLAHQGWTLTHVRKPYTDPEVFRQQWLICLNGVSYPERTFYRLFGSTPFRKLFRYALSHVPCTRDTLEQLGLQEALLTSFLTFLQDQGWLHVNGCWFERGSYQRHIPNIGKTLEWYVAEWFRLTMSTSRLTQVRHGVQLAELPIPGDLDVVAFLNTGPLVIVECKSRSDVDEAHFSLFLQRVQSFHPDFALLLIDTSTPFAQIRIDTFNHALHYLGYPSLIGRGGFYRGPNNIFIVNVGTSIAVSLNDVLNYYQWHNQLLPDQDALDFPL